MPYGMIFFSRGPTWGRAAKYSDTNICKGYLLQTIIFQGVPLRGHSCHIGWHKFCKVLPLGYVAATWSDTFFVSSSPCRQFFFRGFPQGAVAAKFSDVNFAMHFPCRHKTLQWVTPRGRSWHMGWHKNLQGVYPRGQIYHIGWHRTFQRVICRDPSYNMVIPLFKLCYLVVEKYIY